MSGTGARVQLVRDATFAHLTADGSITGTRGTSPDGLFARDARHLSRWQLTVDGDSPFVLSPAAPSGEGAAECVLTPEGTRDAPPAYAVFRRQAVAAGEFTDALRIVGSGAEPLTAEVTLTVGADFADLFELRADDRAYAKPGAEYRTTPTATGVEFGYRREDWYARTAVTADPAPDEVEVQQADGSCRLTWRLHVPPHGQAELRLRTEAQPYGPPLTAAPGTSGAEGPTGTDPLSLACAKGLDDLRLLTIPATGVDGETVGVPAAGIPWFLTLFGRDSLLTSYFMLPYRPELAAGTLSALAAVQGERYDAYSGEQPGRIVHETRLGELAHFRQVPYGRYYGAVDATPLFLVLLHAHWARTADDTLARRLEAHARAAVAWMTGDGGLDEHGYLVYSPDPDGLVNQNWKDSAGAVCFKDGRQAEGPIAVCEAQGYAYDALRRTARVAEEVWQDPSLARELDARADDLRARFVRDFWLADDDFPALALDGKGQQVDALASDAGHLLWSGILDEDRARRVGRRLVEPDFFSGWAIRTLAAGQLPYHPLSYHRGSAWPHDNGVIALGLARYGLADELRKVAAGLTEAAAHHGYRLPEVLGGYERAASARPVPYPHSCSPQAWAAATPWALRTALESVGG
ncbi:glycogen debranching N-terminal domain-containing protein [Streptomyces indicus]|uniref:Glycogen debranching enzyme (Alpha-1,6-glucosidase) n=1 Tax=Streptomyces indicus TaxID=417292 RepID=A0A1G9HAY9_9ACTN|nr:glycogen debranching N-terminal domain-containing protein [Streptomyces indicus]SDL10002.1 Glycogen debranching enzyme (alpha-1,6-glucosidase) [Streptomyces indicus]